MKTFKQFFEISLNADAPEIIVTSKSARGSSKLLPTPEKTFIIPIKISYGIYNVFNRYSRRFPLASDLLLRRGDSVDFVTLKASNEEIAELKELAEYIIKYSIKKEEIRTAESAIDSILHALGQKV